MDKATAIAKIEALCSWYGEMPDGRQRDFDAVWTIVENATEALAAEGGLTEEEYNKAVGLTD